MTPSDFAWFIFGFMVGMVSLLQLWIVSMQKGYTPTSSQDVAKEE